MEAAVGASLTTGILFVQTIIYAKKLTWRPVTIAMFAQFFLVFCRQITVTIAAASPVQDCYANTVIGLLFYHSWVVLIQYIIYIRTVAFILNPIIGWIFTGVCFSSFVTQLVIRYYQIANVAVTSTTYCSTITKGPSMSTANFGLITSTLLFMTIPFFYQFYVLFYDSAMKGKSWWQTASLNFIAVVTIIVIEFVARMITNDKIAPIFPNYVGLMFSIINCTEANLILLLILDTKSAMSSRQPSYKQDYTGGTSMQMSATDRNTKPDANESIVISTNE